MTEFIRSHAALKEAKLIVSWIEKNYPGISAVRSGQLEVRLPPLSRSGPRGSCWRWEIPGVDILASRFNRLPLFVARTKDPLARALNVLIISLN